MFCSLKTEQSCRGIFFGTLLLLLVLKKTHIHSACEISFSCGGRQSDSQCASWFHRCRPGWHLEATPRNSDSLTVLLLQLTDRTIKPKMNPQGLLCCLCFVYRPKSVVTLPQISTMETFTRRNILHSG